MTSFVYLHFMRAIKDISDGHPVPDLITRARALEGVDRTEMPIPRDKLSDLCVAASMENMCLYRLADETAMERSGFSRDTLKRTLREGIREFYPRS